MSTNEPISPTRSEIQSSIQDHAVNWDDLRKRADLITLRDAVLGAANLGRNEPIRETVRHTEVTSVLNDEQYQTLFTCALEQFDTKLFCQLAQSQAQRGGFDAFHTLRKYFDRQTSPSAVYQKALESCRDHTVLRTLLELIESQDRFCKLVDVMTRSSTDEDAYRYLFQYGQENGYNDALRDPDGPYRKSGDTIGADLVRYCSQKHPRLVRTACRFDLLRLEDVRDVLADPISRGVDLFDMLVKQSFFDVQAWFELLDGLGAVQNPAGVSKNRVEAATQYLNILTKRNDVPPGALQKLHETNESTLERLLETIADPPARNRLLDALPPDLRARKTAETV